MPPLSVALMPPPTRPLPAERTMTMPRPPRPNARALEIPMLSHGLGARWRRVGGPAGAVELKRQVVPGAADKFGMRHRAAIVGRGNEGARAARDRPGRARVEFDAH